MLSNLTHLLLASPKKLRCFPREPLQGEIPDTFGALRYLETLVLVADLKGTIPSSFSSLKSLKVVQISALTQESLLGSMPAGWNSLTQLQSLTLVNNSLEGFPDDARYVWPNLWHIELRLSPLFQMDFVSVLQGSPSLKEIVISESPSISGELSADSPLSWPKNLVIFDVRDTSIRGTVPPSFWDMTELHSILFESTASLRLEIGSNIGNMRNLKYLTLRVLGLFGTIPEEIGRLSSENFLTLSISEAHSLEGTIPSSIGNLKSLTSLHIFQTSVTGTIHDCISELLNLTTLSLASNLLYGPIPPTIGQLKNLSALYLTSNVLNGTLPPSLGQLERLQNLSLYGNQFEGTVPISMANGLLKLQSISLRHNRLEGTIPDFQSRQIEMFDFGDNQLTGSVPPTVAKIASKLILDLNRLGGDGYELPHDIFEGNANAEIIVLASNRFNGTLPVLPPSPFLSMLILSSNNFYGSIPSASYCDTSALIILNDNHLSGPLDDILSPSCSISGLFISRNAFIGTLPPSISNMSSLRELDISGNNFAGLLPPVGRLIWFSAANNMFSGRLTPEFIDSASSTLAKKSKNRVYANTLRESDSEWVEIDLKLMKTNRKGKSSTIGDDSSNGMKIGREEKLFFDLAALLRFKVF